MARHTSNSLSLIALLLILSWDLQAQTQNSDELFEQAHKQALTGNRIEAKNLCQIILGNDPNYADARILLGRIHAWEGAFDSARRHLVQVLTALPEYQDAREALIDVELWSGHPREALRLADAGLQIGKLENKSLLFKKAKALEALGSTQEAISANREALQIDSKYPEALALAQQLDDTSRPNRVKVEYSVDVFDKTFTTWHLTSISLSREQPWGTVIGRGNFASRFNNTASQIEIDVYPKLKKGTYAYLNIGYSSSAIFPKVRIGAELYQSFPKELEASFGIRHLHFAGQDVTVYTGSISKYFGDYWLSFRPAITPGSLGRAFSGNFTVRRYFSDGENYVSLGIAAGSTLDGRYSVVELFRLNSQKIGLEVRKQIGHGLYGVSTFGIERQELVPSGARKRYSLSFAVERRF